MATLTQTAPPQTASSSASHWGTWLRYGLTIFCGAFLLFQVQLLLGKYILPWFGGTPMVWTTCMIFFQILLLGGYLYSHLLSTKLSGHRQAVVHLSMLALSLAAVLAGWVRWGTPILPGTWWRPASPDFPALHIFGVLTVAVSLPYLCLSTNGPLLQSWFAAAQSRVTPYRLYALSNLGSLLGLLTYPFVFEPALRLHVQAWMWCCAYLIFVVGSGWCSLDARRNVLPAVADKVERNSRNLTPRSIQLLWFLLPAFASLMLLASTNLMCQEVAVVPFLWVLPLSLYLLSFIICFDNPKWYRREIFQPLLAASLPMAVLVLLSGTTVPLVRQIVMVSLVLFSCCMVCHGELARLKPLPSSLTRFYLLISAGGATGGLFVALVAPRIFKGFWEFHFGLVGCILIAIIAVARDRESWWHWASPYLGSLIFLGLLLAPEFVSRYTTLGMVSVVMNQLHYYQVLMAWGLLTAFLVFRNRRWQPRYRRFNSAQLASFLMVLALSAALIAQVRFDERLQVDRRRNFYGVLTVERGLALNFYQLRHGQIVHGTQWRSFPKEPTVYFSRRSGIGLLLQNQPRGFGGRNYGIIGLGVGTLAAYGLPGDSIRFYEVNPQVIAYSQGTQPFFTYIRDSAAAMTIVPGDARLSLEAEITQNPAHLFDVLVIDAFSSDAIPVHLLTQEALEIYLQHMRGPDSVLAFHISNRSLDLRPVLSALAARNHLAMVRLCKPRSIEMGESSDWVLLSRNPAALDVKAFQGHISSMPPPNSAFLWTDDYSNVFQLLKSR